MRKIIFLLAILFVGRCFGDSVFVELSNVPADGFVVAPLDMTPAANWLETNLLEATEFYYGDKKIDAVFVPDNSYISDRGTFVAVLPDDVPKGKPIRLRLENTQGYADIKRANFIYPFTATGASTKIVFDKERQGGLPSSITFADGKMLDTMKWFDRLHDPDTGSCNITNVAYNYPVVIEERPFLQVVPAWMNFQGTNASVQYLWFIFPQRELIYVTGVMYQSELRAWKEKHLLELHIPDGSFGKWFGDDKSGTFTGTKQSQTFSRYSDSTCSHQATFRFNNSKEICFGVTSSTVSGQIRHSATASQRRCSRISSAEAFGSMGWYDNMVFHALSRTPS